VGVLTLQAPCCALSALRPMRRHGVSGRSTSAPARCSHSFGQALTSHVTSPQGSASACFFASRSSDAHVFLARSGRGSRLSYRGLTGSHQVCLHRRSGTMQSGRALHVIATAGAVNQPRDQHVAAQSRAAHSRNRGGIQESSFGLSGASCKGRARDPRSKSLL